MNYAAHYDRLIVRARLRVLSGYVERHHVVPKCVGGNNEQSNIVRLTADEYFVAHQLLVKMYPDNRKLAIAAWWMGGRRRAYVWLRQRHSKMMSQRVVTSETRTLLANANRGKTHPDKRCQSPSGEARRRLKLGKNYPPSVAAENRRMNIERIWLPHG